MPCPFCTTSTVMASGTTSSIMAASDHAGACTTGRANWKSRSAEVSTRPSAYMTNVSARIQGMQPATVSTVKRQNGIRAMPAGSEMKVRITGSMREKKTVAEP